MNLESSHLLLFVGSSIKDVKKRNKMLCCVAQQTEVTQDLNAGKVSPIETYSWQKLVVR